MVKKWFALLLVPLLAWSTAFAAPLETTVPMKLTSPAAMLVEAETGTVINERTITMDRKRERIRVTDFIKTLLNKFAAGNSRQNTL